MTDTLDVAWLVDLPSQKRARVLQRLTPEERKAVERAIENETPWRSSPLSLALHLDRYNPFDLKPWPYVRLLSEKFVDAVEGRSKRQIWNLPARSGKSLLASRWGPIWCLDRNPRTRLILVSYGDQLARENAAFCRDVLRDAPELRGTLRFDRRSADRFVTNEGGGLLGAGIRATVAGFGADGLVIDDPFKDWIEAHSQAARDLVDNQYKAVLHLRLESDLAWEIIVTTRWHRDDICGRLMDRMEQGTGEAWELVRLPMRAESADPRSADPVLRSKDPLGRAPGELLEPERFDEAAVNARALVLGSYLWASLEQQRPSPEEGGIIKRAWWKIEDYLPPSFDLVISSWDCKLKEKESGDYTVGQVWGRTGKDCWLIDEIRGQWSQALTASAMCLLSVRYPECSRHLVENAGYGPEVMESLRTPAPGYEVSDDVAGQLGMSDAEREAVSVLRRRGLAGIIPVVVKGSKYVRIVAVSGYIEAGDVHLQASAPWLPGYLEEFSSFPNGTHDDRVDTTSQALSRLHRVRRGRGSGEVQRQIRAGSVG